MQAWLGRIATRSPTESPGATRSAMLFVQSRDALERPTETHGRPVGPERSEESSSSRRRGPPGRAPERDDRRDDRHRAILEAASDRDLGSVVVDVSPRAALGDPGNAHAPRAVGVDPTETSPIACPARAASATWTAESLSAGDGGRHLRARTDAWPACEDAPEPNRRFRDLAAAASIGRKDARALKTAVDLEQNVQSAIGRADPAERPRSLYASTCRPRHGSGRRRARSRRAFSSPTTG